MVDPKPPPHPPLLLIHIGRPPPNLGLDRDAQATKTKTFCRKCLCRHLFFKLLQEIEFIEVHFCITLNYNKYCVAWVIQVEFALTVQWTFTAKSSTLLHSEYILFSCCFVSALSNNCLLNTKAGHGSLGLNVDHDSATTSGSCSALFLHLDCMFVGLWKAGSWRRLTFW